MEQNHGLKSLLTKTEADLQKAVDQVAYCRRMIKQIKSEISATKPKKPKANVSKSDSNRANGRSRKRSAR